MYSEKMPHKRLPVSGNNGFDTSQRRGEGSFQRGDKSSGSGAQVVVNTNDDDEKSREQKRRGAWVEPRELPPASRTLVHHQAEKIEGNAPLDVKQLCLNTYASYGVDGMNEPDNGGSGNDVDRSMFSEAFGYSAGRQVRFVRMDVQGPGWEPLSSSVSGPTLDLGPASISSSQATNHSSSIPGICIKPEAQSVRFEAEITIDRTMVNGNGMLHGGCIAYFVDNLGSVSLVALGLLRGRPDSGVGVTQALNILFHAPAPLGSVITFVSTSLVLGRVMTARCEISHKPTGRLIASAFINKMEPKL